MKSPLADVVNDPINEFKPFAVAEDADILGQIEYEQSMILKKGFKRGLARSVEVNKALRPSSSVVSAVTQFMLEKTGEAIRDNGDIGMLQRQFETAVGSVVPVWTGEAGGRADAVTVSFSPSLSGLENGLTVRVRAVYPNETATPTFEADGTGAKVIVKGNNRPLARGDVAGAGHWLELQYDEKLDKWVLENPATGIVASGVPVGTVEYFAAATPPAGYLTADGSAVGRETYPDLFSAIGTTFGEGDGETTFHLQDLRGEFVRGFDDGRGVDSGRVLGTSQIATHVGVDNDSDGAVKAAAYAENQNLINMGYEPAIRKGENLYMHVEKQNIFRGQGDINYWKTVRPRNVALLACIKAFDAAANPGLIDLTQLAQEMAAKTDARAAAHAAMPSTRYVDLPFGLTGGDAAFGYIDFTNSYGDGYLQCTVTGENACVSFSGAYGSSKVAATYPANAQNTAIGFLPVEAGAYVRLYLHNAVEQNDFRFVYANGNV